MARLAIALGIAFGAVIVLSYGFRHGERGAYLFAGAVLLIAGIWLALDARSRRSRTTRSRGPR